MLAGLGHGDLPPHRREIGELSGLKRAAFSTEDLLLDSGHAFVWPRLSRSRSVHVGLANLTDLHERPHPLPDDDVAATLSQCTRAQRNFIGALLNIASKLVQYESKEVRRIQLYVHAPDSPRVTFACSDHHRLHNSAFLTTVCSQVCRTSPA